MKFLFATAIVILTCTSCNGQDDKTVSRDLLVNTWKYDKVTTKKIASGTSGATLSLKENGDYLLNYGIDQGFERGKWQLKGNQLSLKNENDNAILKYKVSFKKEGEILVLKDNIGGTIVAITYEAYNKQRQ